MQCSCRTRCTDCKYCTYCMYRCPLPNGDIYHVWQIRWTQSSIQFDNFDLFNFVMAVCAELYNLMGTSPMRPLVLLSQTFYLRSTSSRELLTILKALSTVLPILYPIHLKPSAQHRMGPNAHRPRQHCFPHNLTHLRLISPKRCCWTLVARSESEVVFEFLVSSIGLSLNHQKPPEPSSYYPPRGAKQGLLKLFYAVDTVLSALLKVYFC